MRQRLPDTRKAITHKFNVGGYTGYFSVGLFDNGKPGELFITMAKEGSTVGGLMDAIGILTSMALQHGVPLDTIAKKFRGQRFEPSGTTTNAHLPEATSITDYIFRWMAMAFSDENENEKRMADQPGTGDGSKKDAAQPCVESRLS